MVSYEGLFFDKYTVELIHSLDVNPLAEVTIKFILLLNIIQVKKKYSMI